MIELKDIIKEENKKKYAARVDSTLSKTSQFAPEKIYAKIYQTTSLL